MKNLVLGLVLLVAPGFPAAMAADTTNTVRMPVTGFSIAPLEAAPAGETVVALAMTLPPSDGFAPNVNVMVQPYKDTIAAYRDLSVGQIKAAGYVLRPGTRSTADSVTMEYTGEMKGRRMHWYSRAQKRGDSVYLATASGTEAQWLADGAKLKACVDSLRAEPAGAK